MLSKTMQDAINEQINNELYSAYLYLSMSAYFESINLPGSANWMKGQHDEENMHAMKMFDYVNDRGGRVVLTAIAQPTTEFDSPASVWDEVLAHEQKVSTSIHKLYELALREKDYASQALLTWFITEQVEEEKNAAQIVDTLRLVGGQLQGLFQVDRMLAARAAH